MRELLVVGMGGMLGTMSRYAIGSLLVQTQGRFPWATLFVNLFGCLLIGIASGCIERFDRFNFEWRLFVIVGFLGGFTTFSAFGIETLRLLKAGSEFLAICYVLSSLILGIALVYVGLKVSH